jgi:hypothetical protein
MSADSGHTTLNDLALEGNMVSVPQRIDLTDGRSFMR